MELNYQHCPRDGRMVKATDSLSNGIYQTENLVPDSRGDLWRTNFIVFFSAALASGDDRMTRRPLQKSICIFPPVYTVANSSRSFRPDSPSNVNNIPTTGTAARCHRGGSMPTLFFVTPIGAADSAASRQQRLQQLLLWSVLRRAVGSE